MHVCMTDVTICAFTAHTQLLHTFLETPNTQIPPTTSVPSTSSSVTVAVLLIDRGADINLYNGRYLSPMQVCL